MSLSFTFSLVHLETSFKFEVIILGYVERPWSSRFLFLGCMIQFLSFLLILNAASHSNWLCKIMVRRALNWREQACGLWNLCLLTYQLVLTRSNSILGMMAIWGSILQRLRHSFPQSSPLHWRKFGRRLRGSDRGRGSCLHVSLD